MKFLLLKKKVWVILAVILLLAGALRFYKLGEKSFSADEFLGVNTAYGYLQLGEWRRWDFNLEKPFDDNAYFKTFFDFDFWRDGEETYTRAWVYNWQVAQSLKFLPDASEWSYRVVSVFWGIISVLAIYLISLKMTGSKTIGLIAAFLMAISIDGIEFSRRMRMYAMFGPVFLIFTYYAFNFFEAKLKSKIKWINELNKRTGFNFLFLFPTILLGLLSMHLHLLAANFVFIAFIYFVAMSFLEFKKTKKILNHYSIYSLVGLFLGVGMTLQGNILISSLSWQDHYSYFDKSFSDYSSLVIALFFIFSGVYYLLKNKQKEGVFLLSSYAVIFLGAVFLWDRNSGEQYLFFAKPFQVILIASGIFAIANFLKNNLKNYNAKAYFLFIVVSLLATVNLAYFFQSENTYTQTSASENPNYRKVFNYILSERNPKDVLITRNFRNFYWQGAQMKVFSLGGERAELGEKKITLEKLAEIIKSNPSGWIVYSDNDADFISKEARDYIEKNLIKINNLQTRGPISVYRWGEVKK